MRTAFWRILPALYLIALPPMTTARAADARPVHPNIVVVFTDDQGYGDLGCYGARGFQTPNIDRLAAEGMRFSDWYVAQPVCSSSRTALLTGCYPNRLGIVGALGPKARHGIHDAETTLAEVCRSQGYRTAMYGKWHLGHHPQFLPTRHGFDEYYGLPYSNDMWPLHPTSGRDFPPLPLIEGVQTIALNPDQRQLTTAYTERAVSFIERNQDHPFFLYVAHSMPHVPLHVSDKFQGKSERGLFGDVISEIDWSVGQIVDTLAKHGLDRRTLVIFTCDNGPWLLYGDHAGSAAPLREGKASVWEGGVRVPCIMRFPGQIAAGAVCHEPLMTIDLLPTIARLVGATPPSRPIDGLDIWPILSGQPGAHSPHEALYFYWLNDLHALRSGRWKLHFPHRYPHLQLAGGGGKPGRYEQLDSGLELYDLETDVGETKNVADEHPDVVARLKSLAETAREDLGDGLTKRQGKNLREPGRL